MTVAQFLGVRALDGTFEMSRSAHATTDHEVIRRWVEKRGGRPATIADTDQPSQPAGVLRFDFPGGALNPPLKPITWEEFFEKFEKERLAMIYQDELSNGDTSYFSKFVDRDRTA